MFLWRYRSHAVIASFIRSVLAHGFLRHISCQPSTKWAAAERLCGERPERIRHRKIERDRPKHTIPPDLSM